MNPLHIVVKFFTYPLEVFLRLLMASDTLGFFYAIFTMAVVYRLLIVPIIGQSLREQGSDTAKKKKSGKNDDN